MNFFDRLIGRSKQYPVVSFAMALDKVAKRNYRTVGKRNADRQLEIFLCTPTGLPLAIVDFEGRGSEVRE